MDGASHQRRSCPHTRRRLRGAVGVFENPGPSSVGIFASLHGSMPGGLIGAIKRVGGEARIHGVLYLWKGVYTNLLRDISFSALHWLM